MTSRRALISVYHKEGIVEFARDLVDMGWLDSTFPPEVRLVC